MRFKAYFWRVYYWVFTDKMDDFTFKELFTEPVSEIKTVSLGDSSDELTDAVLSDLNDTEGKN